MARSVTERGFTTYDEFTDTYGSKITVRESSAASVDAVWVFCEPAYDGGQPHLDLDGATRLRDALSAWIRDHDPVRLRVCAGRRAAWLDGREIRLTAKPRALLLALAGAAGELVPRDVLEERIWDGFASRATVNMTVLALRRCMGDDARGQEVVLTVKSEGYRLGVSAEVCDG